MVNGTLRAENKTKCSDPDILECDETYTFVRVKPRLAALYPTIGIILQVRCCLCCDVTKLLSILQVIVIFLVIRFCDETKSKVNKSK